MPVDDFDVPAERSPFVVQRIEASSIFGPRALLQTVAVDDQRQVFELAMSCREASFPVAAFLQFAVAGQHERAVVGAVDLPGNGNAGSYREPVPERACIGFNAGQ